LKDATGVQIAGVLDDLYAAQASQLSYGPAFSGAQATLRVWAPTARSVKLRLFDSVGSQPRVLDLARDAASGSWSGSGAWRDKYYQFEVVAWQPATQRVET